MRLELPQPIALDAPKVADVVALVRPGAVLRRLEGTERMVALGSARFHSCFNVVSMLEIQGPITLERLREAAARVQRQHGCLQVEVTEEPGDGWVFRETSEPVRVEVMEATHPDSWRDAWDRMARVALDGLAWRLIWVRGVGASQVVVGFHHSISDISSLLVFFDGLLKALSEVEAGRPSPVETMPLHGALTQMVKSRWPLGAMARMAWQRCFRRLRTLPLDRDEPVGVEQRRWGGTFRAVAPAPLEALLDRCRSNGLSLGHVISAATVLEVADRVRVQEGLRKFDVALNTSLDLRRDPRLGLNPRQMGLWVAVVQTRYTPLATDDVWSLARRVRGAIDVVKRRNEHRDLALTPQLVGPRIASWLVKRNQGRPPEGALVLSNYGRIEGLEHGPFSAQRIHFTAAQAAYGCALLLASSTLRGTMYLHLGHPSPGISEATGAAVIDGVLGRLGVQ